MMRKRSIIAGLLSLTLLTGFGVNARPASAATNGQVFQITGTEIGIMFRTDPNNWESRSGPAGYDGDDVTIYCAVQGIAVGPYNNRTWYKASTALGSGLLPDRFLNTPVNANELPAGIGYCDTESNTQISGSQPTSVFFSGTNIAKGSAATSVSDHDYALSQWASGGDCQGGHVPALVADSVDTLAGWSRGRIGIVYFLANASEEARSNIHRIILFDPGSTSDIAGSLGFLHRDHGCDFEYDVNGLLANWLQQDERNHLIVFTGIKSEMKEDSGDTSSQSTFAGLWKYYFAGIWEQPFADRALVCDYNALSHERTLSEFAKLVKHPQDSCPTAPSGHPLQAWHP